MVWTPVTTFGILAQFGGLWFAVSGLRAVIRGHRTKRWPSTKGRVRRSRVVTAGAYHFGKSMLPNRPLFRPDIEYEYTVNEHRLVGSFLGYGGHPPGEAACKHICDQHRVGAPVTVYYDPSDPERALLHPGVADYSTFEFIAGIFVFCVATVVRVVAGACCGLTTV